VTDQLELDALSERVAEVLGWICCPIGWYRLDKAGRPPVSFGDYTILPRFASDWSLLPEMVEWLRERDMDFEIFFGDDLWYVTAGSSFDFYGTCDCDTLPEAVARLVVAVAEREAGK
jgi:hypothetical protein